MTSINTADVTTKLHSEVLQKLVQQIVNGFHPQKVILFGSYAYGMPREDSDLDLLVVMEAGGRPLRAAANIAAAIDHPLSLDILVFEPGHLESAVEREFTFATEVMARGIVLHSGQGP
jgi:predicted nucleotidyltransferase